MWSLSWWPHAILHGLNPFVSHYLWSPTGISTATATVIPTAALLMTPFTLALGPIFSYNFLSILSPILCSFTTYLLCRRLVRQELSSLVGGYLFGFSSYEFAQLTGHLNLTLVFLVPLMPYLALRRVDGELGRKGFLAAMALLFLLQAGLSTEILADSVGVGAVALLTARFLTERSRRRDVDRLIGEIVAAGVIALAVGSIFFYYALFRSGIPRGPSQLSDIFGLDALNLVFPTYVTWFGHNDFLSLGLLYNMKDVTEADGYLGIPLIAAFLLWALRDAAGTWLSRFLMVVATVSLVFALGSHLHVAGHETVALPYQVVRNVAIFDDIVPSRIVLFTTLAVAVGVASWLALCRRGVAARWVLVALAVFMTFPNLLRPLYGARPHDPAFFDTALYRRYLKRGETVLVLPFGVNDMSTLWQAQTGFYFYMPEGYLSGVIPAPFNAQATVQQLEANAPPPAGALGTFIREHHVTHVVVDPQAAGPWPGALSQLGLVGQSVGGVLLYAVPKEG
jgi:hypothetical protein